VNHKLTDDELNILRRASYPVTEEAWIDVTDIGSFYEQQVNAVNRQWRHRLRLSPDPRIRQADWKPGAAPK
jgi:hypothetical protein